MAQRSRASLTRKRSLVRSQYRPLGKVTCLMQFRPPGRKHCIRGRSSAGRAPPCQGGCREFESRRPLSCFLESRWPVFRFRAIGAAVARFPDTEEVTGSIPVSPTSSSSPRSCFFYLPGHPSPTRHHRAFPYRGDHSRQSEPVGGTASAAGERPEPPISLAGLPGGARIECGGATWLRD